MPSLRNHKYCVLLSTEEVRMLKAVASDLGVAGADVLRTDLRQRHEARFGRPPTPTPTPHTST
jgi:hypothetical protein